MFERELVFPVGNFGGFGDATVTVLAEFIGVVGGGLRLYGGDGYLVVGRGVLAGIINHAIVAADAAFRCEIELGIGVLGCDVGRGMLIVVEPDFIAYLPVVGHVVGTGCAGESAV